MTTTTTEQRERPATSYHSGVKRIWCPGCGDFGALSAFYETLSRLHLDPEDLAIVSGIGCSGRFSHIVKGYCFHGVHGRALPTAIGLQLARPDLNEKQERPTIEDRIDTLRKGVIERPGRHPAKVKDLFKRLT